MPRRGAGRSAVSTTSWFVARLLSIDLGLVSGSASTLGIGAAVPGGRRGDAAMPSGTRSGMTSVRRMVVDLFEQQCTRWRRAYRVRVQVRAGAPRTDAVRPTRAARERRRGAPRQVRQRLETSQGVERAVTCASQPGVSSEGPPPSPGPARLPVASWAPTPHGASGRLGLAKGLGAARTAGGKRGQCHDQGAGQDSTRQEEEQAERPRGGPGRARRAAGAGARRRSAREDQRRWANVPAGRRAGTGHPGSDDQASWTSPAKAGSTRRQHSPRPRRRAPGRVPW